MKALASLCLLMVACLAGSCRDHESAHSPTAMEKRREAFLVQFSNARPLDEQRFDDMFTVQVQAIAKTHPVYFCETWHVDIVDEGGIHVLLFEDLFINGRFLLRCNTEQKAAVMAAPPMHERLLVFRLESVALPQILIQADIVDQDDSGPWSTPSRPIAGIELWQSGERIFEGELQAVLDLRPTDG